jgi:membrane carboxypeptidase/penicillin-binding protein
MDPHSGEVRAMVGGRDFGESRFNRAMQARRQPGSAFKPFVYAAALERGFSPATLLTNLDAPTWTPQGNWVPDDGHSTESSMTMRTALRTSSNRAAVRMLHEVGIPATVQYAQRLGVGDVPSVPSLALGSGEVTLMSMAAAFATFANDGIVPVPTLIRRVETTAGEVLYTSGSAPHRAVSEATAFLMTNMLADVVNSGTAWSARRLGFTLPAAGKTGTTNDYHDAWFVGYTPKLVAGVWVGYDMPKTIIRNGYAAELAVPIWARFMKTATKRDKPEWFKAPPTVTSATICRISGKRATDACRYVNTIDRDGDLTTGSQAYTEHFVRGTQPQEYCDLHGRYEEAWRAVATHGSSPSAPGSTAAVSAAAVVPDSRSAAASATAGQAAVVTGGTLPETRQPEPPTATTTERRGFWSRIFRRGQPQRPPQPAPQSPQQEPAPRDNGGR